MATTVENWIVGATTNDLNSNDYAGRLLLRDLTRERNVTLRTSRAPGGRPTFVRSDYDAHVFPLVVYPKSGGSGTLAELIKWFEPGTSGALEIADGGTQKFLDCVVMGTVPDGTLLGGLTVKLWAGDTRWRSSQQTTTDSNITSSPGTQAVSNDGDADDDGMVIDVTLDTQKASSDSWTRVRHVNVANRANSPLSNYPIRISFDHAAETTADSQADGDDVRVYVDGVEVPRWSPNWDEADTGVWWLGNYSAGREVKLLSAITAGSPATAGTLELEPGGLEQLPTEGAIVITDTGEVIEYTGKQTGDANTAEGLTGITRGARNTTAASADASDSAWWVEHRVELIYGYSNATAPETRDDIEPILDLANSTNATWAWGATEGFLDETLPRAAQWGRTKRTIDQIDGQVVATVGSPATSLLHSISRTGAVAGRPNANAWRRGFPVPIKAATPTSDWSEQSWTSATSVSVSPPSNIEDDDLLVACVAPMATTITPPFGWTALVANGVMWFGYKIASSESGNYDWSTSGGATTGMAVVGAIHGAGAFVAPTNSDTATSATTLDFAVTPESALVIFAMVADSATMDPPDGFTEVYNSALNNRAIAFSTRQMNGGGEFSDVIGTSGGTLTASGAMVVRLPTGLSVTSKVDGELALAYYLTDVDGNEAYADVEQGEKASAAYVVGGGPGKLANVDIVTFDQVVASAPESRPYTVYTQPLSTGPTNDGQQITSGDEGAWVTGVDVRGYRATADQSLRAYIYTDVSGTPTSAISGTFLGTVTVTNTSAAVQRLKIEFDEPVWWPPSTTYWVTLTHDGAGGGSVTLYGASAPYSGGPVRDTSTNDAGKCLDVRLFTRTPVSERWDGSAPLVYDESEVTAITAAFDDDTPRTPYVNLEGEETDAYHCDAVLTNVGTSQTATFNLLARADDVIQIDVANRTVRNTTQDLDVRRAVEFSDAAAWFTLEPGSQNFTWAETGVANVDIDYKHYDRWVS